MKPKCLERVTLDYEGVPLTAKVLLIANKEQERYFIYANGFPTCGGYGWKSLENMYRCFQWFKQFPRATTKRD